MRPDGDRIRILRRGLSLSQVAICEQTAVTVSTWKAAEAGQRISVTSAVAIAGALGVPVAAVVRPDAALMRLRVAEEGLAPPRPVGPGDARGALAVRAACHLCDPKGPAVVCIAQSRDGEAKRVARGIVAQVDVGRAFDDVVLWLWAPEDLMPPEWLATRLAIARALAFGHLLHAPAGGPAARAGPGSRFGRAFRIHLSRRRVLVVLADACTVEQVRLFFDPSDPLEPAASRVAFLVTTRAACVADWLRAAARAHQAHGAVVLAPGTDFACPETKDGSAAAAAGDRARCSPNEAR